MDSFGPDVILLDMNFRRDAISGEEGYRWLDFILKKDPKALVLFITAYVDTRWMWQRAATKRDRAVARSPATK